MKEPISFLIKSIVEDEIGKKDFLLVKHPKGKSKFPDYEAIDSETKETIAYFDSKGTKAKTTEVTNKSLLEKAKNFPGVKKMLLLKEKGKSVPLSRKEVEDILEAYNINKKNIFYFNVDLHKRDSKIKRLVIPFSIFESFGLRKKSIKKMHTYEIFGILKEVGSKYGILRIEFRPSGEPAPSFQESIKEEILRYVRS
jgi:hypothetical protein